MPKFSVMLQLPLNIRVLAIEAQSQEEAVEKAWAIADEDRNRYSSDPLGDPVTGAAMFVGAPRVAYHELSEDQIVAALVDNEGDEDYEDSIWYEPNPKDGKFLPLGKNDLIIGNALINAQNFLATIPVWGPPREAYLEAVKSIEEALKCLPISQGG